MAIALQQIRSSTEAVRRQQFEVSVQHGQSLPGAQTSGFYSASLPKKWLEACRRFEFLEKHLQRDYGKEWSWLLKWQEQAHARGLEMPPPFVFADAQNNLSLEWEVGDRLLTLRLTHNPDNGFEYGKSVEDDTTDDEQGRAGIAEVCNLIAWVLGS